MRVGALLAVCAAIAITGAALPAEAGARSSAKRMVQRINVIRASHGLPKARFSKSLTRSSKRYARRLMRRGAFAHGSFIQASRAFGSLGEVLEIHRTYRSQIVRTVNSWLGSPSHRSVVLSRTMNHVGAGRARGSFHGSSSTIWVAHFGRR
jgi:uncharacterized protein YkwD